MIKRPVQAISIIMVKIICQILVGQSFSRNEGIIDNIVTIIIGTNTSVANCLYEKPTYL